MKTRNEMKFATINDYRKTNYKRRTNASVPVLVQGLSSDVLDCMLMCVDERFKRRVELSDGQVSFGYDVVERSASAPSAGTSFFAVL